MTDQKDGIFPVRQDIEIMSADPPRDKTIGWTCHIITDEEIKEQDSPENVKKRATERAATEEADSYLTNHAKTYKKSDGRGWTTLPVLEQIWGRPWNAAALNFVEALRPSAIRVAEGCTTLDCYTWRVTVYLAKDKRTIKKIEQEVEVGLRGFRNGQDASNYLRRQDEWIDKEQPNIIINSRALEKLCK